MNLRELSSTTSLTSSLNAPEPTKTISGEPEADLRQEQTAPNFAEIGQELGIETPIGDEIELGDGEISGPDTPAILSPDAFYQNFKGLLAAPNVLLMMKQQEPLKSLEIQPEEEDSARAATDYLHKLACKTPWLKWMVSPQSETMQGLMIVGAFAVPKALAINAELQERRKPLQQAANDNAGAHAQAG